MTTNNTGPVQTQLRHEVDWARVDELNLDPANPRLPPDLADKSQEALLSTLAKEYDLTELGQSLADHGYFSEEPLVVVVENGTKIVVEGNRRLAALKLLSNPSSAPRAYIKRWQELSAGRKAVVVEVPILTYVSRLEVIPYLGYRHITGVLPWGPYQKARYIAQLVERSEMTFLEIARAIGSKSPTVREHYITYTLIRQAKDDFGIDISKALQSFGVLRRALVNPHIRTFIGIKIEGPEGELRKPVPTGKAPAVDELFGFLFGYAATPAVLRDSRQLTELGIVLSKADTTEVLRQTQNLDDAFKLAGGEEQLAIEVLDDAAGLLSQALPLTSKYADARSVGRAFRRVQEAYEALARQFPERPE